MTPPPLPRPPRPHLPLLALALLVVGCAAGGDATDRVYQADEVGRVERDPEAAAGLNRQAADAIAAGDLARAATLLRDAARLDPASAAILNNFATLQYRRGELYEAAWAYRRAAELRPGDARIWSNLGLVLEAGRDYDDAVTMHARAAEIEPAEPTYRRRLARARVLRGDGDADLAALLRELIADSEADGDGAWHDWAARQLREIEG